MNGRQVQGSGDGKMANLVAQLWEIFTSERFKVYRYRYDISGHSDFSAREKPLRNI